MDAKTAITLARSKKKFIGHKGVLKNGTSFIVKDILYYPKNPGRGIHMDTVKFIHDNGEYLHREVKGVCCGETDKDNASAD